jgi:transcriptional regulator with XRE-family HTH domain
VFYDKYAQLCKKRGISVSAAATEAGLSKSLVTKWKTNKVDVPSPDVLKKLSAYFCIPVSELLDEKENPSQPKSAEGIDLSNITETQRMIIEAVLNMPVDRQNALAQILGLEV